MVYLFLDNIVPTDEPQAAFGGMTGVHTLHISGHYASKLLNILTVRLEPKEDEEDSDGSDNEAITHLPLLPAVRTVVLHNTRLLPSKHALEFVNFRAQCGCAILKISLSGCRNVSALVDELRSKVRVVEWDGQD